MREHIYSIRNFGTQEITNIAEDVINRVERGEFFLIPSDKPRITPTDFDMFELPETDT